MGEQKSVHAFQHEHKGEGMSMKFGRLENSGVRGDNTEHKSSG